MRPFSDNATRPVISTTYLQKLHESGRAGPWEVMGGHERGHSCAVAARIAGAWTGDTPAQAVAYALQNTGPCQGQAVTHPRAPALALKPEPGIPIHDKKEDGMFRKLILTTAVSAALATTPALAQQAAVVVLGQSENQARAQEHATAQGTRIFLSPASVLQIQQALNAQGYNTGTLSGRWNSLTAAAAQRYQLSQGLEPTGTPTIGLINALGIDRKIATQAGEQAGRTTRGDGQQPQEGLQASGVPLYVGPSSVREVEQALNRQGYPVGQVDGIWDAGASRAAAQYQRDNSLEPTGQLDVNLISALGLDRQIFARGKGGEADPRWDQDFVVSRGTALWASPATIRQVEVILNQNGFPIGSVDGRWNDQVVQAVQRYQRTRGLEPTGTLTVVLLNDLGVRNFLTGEGAQLGQTRGQARQASQSQQGQQGRQAQQSQQAQQAQQLTRQDFQRLDQNGDGQLSEDELSAYGAAAGGEQLLKRYDEDGDGVVSRQDLQLQLQGQPDPMDMQEMNIGQTPARPIQQLTRQDFRRLDQNQDGRLTEDELSQYGSPAAGQSQLLERYDQDGNGTVSRQELQQGPQARQQPGQQKQDQQAPIPAVPPMGEQADREN